jgi:hypothetical protein
MRGDHRNFCRTLIYSREKGNQMVEITIEADKAIFEVEGWDKLWSLRSRLEIPLSHIKGAHADSHPAMGWFQGLKLMGTDLPNIFRAGTFYQEGGLVFWDVHHPEKTIVVELEHERFEKLVIEVDDTEAAISFQVAPGRACQSSLA